VPKSGGTRGTYYQGTKKYIESLSYIEGNMMNIIKSVSEDIAWLCCSSNNNNTIQR